MQINETLDPIDFSLDNTGVISGVVVIVIAC